MSISFYIQNRKGLFSYKAVETPLSLVSLVEGLPNIFNRSQLKEIKNLKIISRKAAFNFNDDLDLVEELKGTLFYWEVDII